LSEEESKTVEGQLLGDLNADEVTEFTMKNDQGGYSLKKENSVWKITAPLVDDANGDAVLTQIRNVAVQKAELVDLSNEDGAQGAIEWDKYGLTQPLAEITIRDGKGETRLTVGRERTYDQGFYVRKN